VTCRGLYVTGTDTGVGKTSVAVAIARHLRAEGRRVGVYKPVASGFPSVCDPDGDAVRLWEAAGRPLAPDMVCPQSFAAAAAPARAARAEGRQVDERRLRSGITLWRAASDVVVVEAAGGLCSPLGDTTLGIDLAREFCLPLVVVDAARLGMIGRVLVTVRAARAEGLRVAAVVVSAVEPLDQPGDDADSPGRIVADGLADLAALLPDLPIGLLSHAADRVSPSPDWWTLAGGLPASRA